MPYQAIYQAYIGQASPMYLLFATLLSSSKMSERQMNLINKVTHMFRYPRRGASNYNSCFTYTPCHILHLGCRLEDRLVPLYNAPAPPLLTDNYL